MTSDNNDVISRALFWFEEAPDGFGPLRGDRGRRPCSDWRSVSLNRGVLSNSSRAHEGTHRAQALQYRCCRSRLARCISRESVGSPRFDRSGCECSVQRLHPSPSVDVAQHRGDRVHRLAPSPECIGQARTRIGFYGLDLYSLHSSVAAVPNYLDKVDRAAAARARYRYGCFEDYSEEPRPTGTPPRSM